MAGVPCRNLATHVGSSCIVLCSKIQYFQILFVLSMMPEARHSRHGGRQGRTGQGAARTPLGQFVGSKAPMIRQRRTRACFIRAAAAQARLGDLPHGTVMVKPSLAWRQTVRSTRYRPVQICQATAVLALHFSDVMSRGDMAGLPGAVRQHIVHEFCGMQLAALYNLRYGRLQLVYGVKVAASQGALEVPPQNLYGVQLGRVLGKEDAYQPSVRVVLVVGHRL